MHEPPQRKPDPRKAAAQDDTVPAVKDPWIGRVLGKCRLIRSIGHGGMGDVYLAEHTLLQKQVAIKLLPPSFTRDPEFLNRFHREAVAAARLDHPNIVQVMDVGSEGDAHYILMQYVAGQSLQKVLDRLDGPMDLKEAARIVAETARALQAAHDAAIVHRDVKPANILIGERGEVKITDFGLARDEDSQSLTSSGEVMGTPHFMSPEQAQGQPTGPRSDIYSLGVTLFVCVTGQRPFTGDTHMSVLYKHIHEDPPPPKAFNAQIPESLSRLILRMMSKAVEDRPDSCEEVAKELDQYIKGTLKAPAKNLASTRHDDRPAPLRQSEHGVVRRSEHGVASRHSEHLSRAPGTARKLAAVPEKPHGAVRRSGDRRMLLMVSALALFAIAATALIVATVSGRRGSTDGASTDPEESPDPAKEADRRYRILLAKARDIEAVSPERAVQAYQDALAAKPDGREAKEALARLAAPPPVPDDERAYAELERKLRDAGDDPAIIREACRDFLDRFPGSARAPGVRRRLEEAEEPLASAEPTPTISEEPSPSETPEPAPELEEGFRWLATTGQAFAQSFSHCKCLGELSADGHFISVDTGTRRGLHYIATNETDIADFSIRFDLKVERGKVILGGRNQKLDSPDYLGVTFTPKAGRWITVDFRIDADGIRCDVAGEKPTKAPLPEHPLNSGRVIFLADANVRFVIRHPRLKIDRREKPVEPPRKSPPPSPTAGPKADPTDLAKVFGDGREVAARDYAPVLRRIDDALPRAGTAMQEILRQNRIRLDLSREVHEAALAALAARKSGSEILLKTREGQELRLRVKRAGDGEIEGTNLSLGGVMVVKFANLHGDTIADQAKARTDLDLALFLLSEGETAGAVKRLFQDAKKLRPQAPVVPFIDHLLAMEAADQLKGGAKDLKAAWDRLTPAADQLQADGRERLLLLSKRISAAEADDRAGEIASLARQQRHKEAMARYLEWIKMGPSDAAIDKLAEELHATFLSEPWKAYGNDKDLADFSIPGDSAGTAAAHGGVVQVDTPKGNTTMRMKSLPEGVTAFAVEVKIDEFGGTGTRGANILFGKESTSRYRLFALFATSSQVIERIGEDFKKAANVPLSPGTKERWVELAVVTAGPQVFFYAGGRLIHRAEAAYFSMNDDCSLIFDQVVAQFRNARFRTGK